MLYNEFIEGTGCKDNGHNYKVYKDLEVMYMNSDISKQEIYEYGKKLVDNSKSSEEIEIENQVKEEIKDHKKEIEYYKQQIEVRKNLIESDPISETEKEWNKDCKRMIQYYREQIAYHRGQVKALEWVLE